MRGVVAARAGGAVALALSALVACGGGGGGVTSPAGSPRSSSFDARFRITIPVASSSGHARAPRFLSPAMRSIAVDVVYGGTSTPTSTVVADLAQGAPGCDVVPGGVSCAVDVSVFTGATALVVRAFAAPGGQGALLGRASLLVPTAVAGSIVDVSLTLNGVVAGITLSIAGGSFAPGQPGSRPIVLTALDAGGNVIVAPGGYDTPIVLTSSDSAVTLSSAPGQPTSGSITIPGPTSTLTATYNGAPTARTVLTATTGSGSASATATVSIVVVGTGTPGPPTPTATPAATATPVPTATPVATAVPTATPTASATPSPVPTATPVVIKISGHH